VAQSWLEADAEKCRAAVADVLKIGRREGIHSWEAVLLGPAIYNELFAGDLPTAERYLEHARPPAHLRRSVVGQHYQFLLSWLRLQQDDFEGAWRSQDPSISCRSDVAGPFPEAVDLITSAYAARGLGDRAGAQARTARVARIAEIMNSDHLRFAAVLLEASLTFDGGQVERGRDLLRTGLALGRQRNLLGFLGWHARSIGVLCAKALDAGIEVDFVRTLIRKRWLPSPPEARLLESWPWPIKIRTLGRFSIEVVGKPLAIGRKAPHRQFDVLKVLVALGGASASIGAVMDTLWPHSDGDRAREALDKTLQRLRRSLGYDQAVKTRDGKIWLNPDLCWIDALAFEALIDAMRRPGTAATSTPESLQADVHRACQLYGGPFLASESDRPWAFPLRERLAQKYLKVAP
jgi:hypothetical protein